ALHDASLMVLGILAASPLPCLTALHLSVQSYWHVAEISRRGHWSRLPRTLQHISLAVIAPGRLESFECFATLAKLPSLTSMTLGRVRKGRSGKVCDLGNLLPRLKLLELHVGADCDDEGLDVVAKHCSALEELSLLVRESKRDEHVHDHRVSPWEVVGEAARNATIWPKLRRLNLRALTCSKCVLATLSRGKA